MRKLTCLFVDDEPPIVNRVAGFFDKWKSQGLPYTLAFKTCSSREAGEQALLLKPDIFITDIVMPEMNGIELIKELQPKLPSTEFIILSAHSDFAYAKQAIAFNVLDYLVKIPLKESELLAALDKAKAKLLQREEKERQYRSAHSALKENVHRIRKQLVEEALEGGGRAAFRAEDVVTSFVPAGYCCFLVKFDDYAAFTDAYAPSDQRALKYGAFNIIEETINREGSGFSCELEPDAFVAYYGMKEKSALAIERRMQTTGAEIRDNLRDYLRLSMSVGCGGPYDGWENAGKACRQAERASWDGFYLGPGSVVTPASRLTYAPEHEAAFVRTMRGLTESFTPLQAEESKRALDEAMASLRTRKVQPRIVLACVQDYMDQVLRKLPGSGDEADAEASLDRLPHWERLLTRIEELWQRVSARLNASGIHPEMQKAMQYIASRLHEPISLGSVAEHVRMNANYVSELFKKELGENFIDYVNRLRIERAMGLMAASKDLSNLELANAVGIQTEKYFCTLFKKYVGVSPQKYMKTGRTK